MIPASLVFISVLCTVMMNPLEIEYCEYFAAICLKRLLTKCCIQHMPETDVEVCQLLLQLIQDIPQGEVIDSFLEVRHNEDKQVLSAFLESNPMMKMQTEEAWQETAFNCLNVGLKSCLLKQPVSVEENHDEPPRTCNGCLVPNSRHPMSICEKCTPFFAGMFQRQSSWESDPRQDSL